ncbi:MAG: radical SAM family heme chaperone HemW [Cyanobacteria bacterium J06621_8]
MTENISLINSHINSSFQAPVAMPSAAYVHLPFCRRRCYYCDFPISVVGDQPQAKTDKIEDYIQALIKEIKLTSPPAKPLQTIFFGGGTPSLVPPAQLEKILQAIALQMGIAPDAEISMEIDPGTFDRNQLLGYLALGVNRFSLGVQTFDEKLLKICGRSHTLSEIMHSIELIQQLNVTNFSLDLISGLPHQTLDHCQKSLEKAIAIAPQHLACYDLVLEPVTAFGKQYQPGETPLPTDNTAAEMYRLTQSILTNAGYQHYEVSNYAQPGYLCRHNRVYWLNQPYYGLGMGAASYVNGQRFVRPPTRQDYYAWLESGAAINVEPVSTTDYLLETLMLGLRLAEGLDLAQFTSPNLQKILSCLQPYYERKWLKVTALDGQQISITQNIPPGARLSLCDPEGFLFSNTILSTLFEQFE